MTLTSSPPQAFTFRCSNCYQTLLAPAKIVGQPLTCQWCSVEIVVPEATPEGIEQAQAIADGSAVLAGNPVVEDPVYRNDEERSEHARKLARKAHASAGHREYDPTSRCASRIARLGAHLVDAVVTSLVCFVSWRAASNAYPIEFADVVMRPGNVPGGFWLLAQGPPLLVALVYWFTISAYGKTVGKLVFGIRIVTSTGRAPGFVRGVLLRHSIAAITGLVPWIPALHLAGAWPDDLMFETRTGYQLASMVCLVIGLADVMAIFLEPPRCLHDRIAGTYVVND